MARGVDESEWLTRTTMPNRLARVITSHVSSRKFQIISCAACRLVEPYIDSKEILHDLDLIEQFAFGECDGSEYHSRLSGYTKSHTDWDMLRTQDIEDEDLQRMAPMLAVASAMSGNIVAGMLRTMEWVLQAGPFEEDISAKLCELIREIVGNPFRPWKIQAEWIQPGTRIAPDGTPRHVTTSLLDFANAIDRERRFDLMPILADELEAAGWHDQDVLHHCRHSTGHVRGCWVVDLIRGME
ncbi:MAG: hypothetical protein U0798_02340 [Gemmataceae bacterium]